MYAVYDMKYKEQCIAIFDTTKEIARYFNSTDSSIRTSITKQYLRNRRYLIKKVEEDK